MIVLQVITQEDRSSVRTKYRCEKYELSGGALTMSNVTFVGVDGKQHAFRTLIIPLWRVKRVCIP